LPSRADRAAQKRKRAMFAEVRDSLWRTPRELPSKYFYDARGSELFERITELPEYYPTRAEREILLDRADDVARLTQACTLVELGAGSAMKTRILLDALTRVHSSGVAYVPVDVSDEFLAATARSLGAEYPSLNVRPVVADMTEPFALPEGLHQPTLFAFLGSTIGNFPIDDAIELLRRVRELAREDDRLLLGTDLHKDRATLEAAYNDAAGVTADFNRNVLRVVNAELGADFVPERFGHRAIYNEADRRIEMYLDAIGDQVVHIPDAPPLVLHDGEGIRTELSHKYDREAVAALLGAAGFAIEEWYTDAGGRFGLSLSRPTV
jgi:L-histidine N-alpha-methyltransferase